MTNKKLSVIVIAKNEEDRIADCLDSLSFCDEIIVVDSGSEDRTKEIAKRMGAKVFDYMSDNFSSLRNFGLEKANNEWILYVDADERVTGALAFDIKYQIVNSKYAVYKIRRKNFYFGSHQWPFIEEIERLFKKKALKGWKGKLHESPIFEGNVGRLNGFLNHYTHRNLTSMVKKTIEWSEIEADLRFKSNHPKVTWWRFLRVMITAFFDSYIRQKGWKAATVGIVESLYQAFSIFITYARLWELQHKRLKIKD